MNYYLSKFIINNNNLIGKGVDYYYIKEKVVNVLKEYFDKYENVKLTFNNKKFKNKVIDFKVEYSLSLLNKNTNLFYKVNVNLLEVNNNLNVDKILDIDEIEKFKTQNLKEVNETIKYYFYDYGTPAKFTIIKSKNKIVINILLEEVNDWI